ncbi:ABC-type phosphate/phosphonate transport system permease subunit [Rhizobium leguminosarum]|uniref:ABC-type phosphate/phosphonate transport system permease subunit n=1 Tax=Rhizobium leguminosarum TaxID=384 RepID=A0AAE2MR97_RHILE|nr:ABC-type phosphate/phosphonate transport system permease subunit [Rhizobium leguminosarum]MBB4435958.1 ABC-type phosphate/phosphonate transport system permease subunit [Rhizobium esperanzae]MBB4300455.1 ABC-type phosphate/phosphonate transport system permease subunit [Rhizobium leguminosarum]MBB4311750.1 ABC-type phosphate/phosphonate transport system permease subunit [Rhizobium leguminosarum]MBB4420610.1 ABC-type phosphate/phosphonate transport system permease subunit [Rhizobium leguminosar
MSFTWISSYWPLLLTGAWQTVSLLVISVVFGFIIAIGLAFAQVSGGRLTLLLARLLHLLPRHAAADTALASLLRRRLAAAPDPRHPPEPVLADPTRGLLLCRRQFHPELRSL